MTIRAMFWRLLHHSTRLFGGSTHRHRYDSAYGIELSRGLRILRCRCGKLEVFEP